MLKKRIFLFFVVFTLVNCGLSYGQVIRMRQCDTSAIRRECRMRVMRLADKGYPFASIVADSAVMRGRRRVDVYCRTLLSQKYMIDNVYILGGAGLSPYYIYMTTGINPGTVFNESRITQAARRIMTGGAAVPLQDAEVEFHPDGAADVYLYLKKRRANAAGAGLALNRDNADGKYFLTGNALADLRNNFGHGERFYFAWNGYDRRSQMLDLQFRWPYIFDTPVVPDFWLNVTRTDTSYLTLQMKGGLGFAVSPDVEVGAVADVRRLVSTIKDDDNDARTSLYGVAVSCRKTTKNNTYINIKSSATGGSRRSGDDKGSVAEIASAVEGELPIGTWARYEGIWIARQMYFAHKPDIYECSPIGGVGSLRGFMANELRATGLLTLCNTFRVLLTEGFSVQAFYDMAFYKCDALQTSVEDTPCGFGAGIGLKTGAMGVDIGWAIGRDRGEMRPLKDAKTLIIMRLEF
jgi:hypothetical protein